MRFALELEAYVVGGNRPDLDTAHPSSLSYNAESCRTCSGMPNDRDASSARAPNALRRSASFNSDTTASANAFTSPGAAETSRLAVPLNDVAHTTDTKRDHRSPR